MHAWTRCNQLTKGSAICWGNIERKLDEEQKQHLLEDQGYMWLRDAAELEGMTCET